MAEDRLSNQHHIRMAQIGKQIEQCEKKSLYPSRGKALKFVGRNGYSTRPYLCPICGGWHLSSHAE